ncbi:MAG TPA: hypothetical protein VL133_07170 [Devosia sp.]|nr:hypothetical protein [Devosia sp.]
MRLAVIQGGLSHAQQGRRAQNHAIRPEDVEAEAARRRRDGKVDEWRVREFITGHTMPPDIKYLELQIDFAAQAICRLSPIPADFADDLYWPTCWAD